MNSLYDSVNAKKTFAQRQRGVRGGEPPAPPPLSPPPNDFLRKIGFFPYRPTMVADNTF